VRLSAREKAVNMIWNYLVGMQPA